MKMEENKNEMQENVEDINLEVCEIKCPIDKILPIRDRCMSTF